MKRGLNSYPKNLFRIYINNGKQDSEIFYVYSELNSVELTDYLSDNVYLILSNEVILKNTLIPSYRIVYIEEIDAKNSQGERVYLYDGTKDYKSSYDSTLAYRLVNNF